MHKNYLIIFTLLLLTFTSRAQVFTCFDIDTNKNYGAGPWYYTPALGKLFFNARTKAHGIEWHVSDGTPGGTHLLKDIKPGPDGSGNVRGVECNGLFFFWADDGNGAELWASDGTTNGTYMIKDVNPPNNWGPYNTLAVYNNKVYFIANHAPYGEELWVTDGTANGTHMVSDVEPGTSGSNISSFTVFNNKLYFTAYNGAGGKGVAIWETDGTDPNTLRMIDMNTTFGAQIKDLMVFNNRLYFMADDATGMHLWATDGTQNGTVKITQTPFWEHFHPYTPNGLVCNNKLYFMAQSSAFAPVTLWVTDGTTTGTKPLVPISNSPLDFDRMVAFKNKIYFSGTTDSLYNLWETDGTDTGTYITYTGGTWAKGQHPLYLTEYNGHLYFEGTTKTSANERRLWRTDGDNMELVDSLMNANPDPLSDTLHAFAECFGVYNGALYFTAGYDTTKGYEMWSFSDQPPVNNIAQQNTTKHNLIIYPNPNNGDFTLQLPEGISGDATVKVFDMTGRCVFAQAVINHNLPVRQAGKTQQLHLANIPAGIYQLQLKTESGMATGRLVIQY